MLEDGSSWGFPGRVLLLGTKPDVEAYAGRAEEN